jgi:hypothetical protein
METNISKTDAAPPVQGRKQAISQVPLQEKKVSGTFRNEKDDVQPGLPGLSPVPESMRGGQVREDVPGQTSAHLLRVPEQSNHCPKCTVAGFGPMTDWEDPRYIALRNLAIIRNQTKLTDSEKASLDPAIRVLTRSVFREERLKKECAAGSSG